MGSVGPLHMGVELRGARWQDKQVQPPLLTGLFEGGLEFGATVHLDAAHREGHALQEGIQEAGGSVSGGLAGHHQHIPAGDDVAPEARLGRER